MKDHRAAGADADHTLEVFAAELTAAAYAVALRHGLGGKWLDLELDLWLVLTETVKKRGRDLLRAGYPGDARPPLSQGARP
jgi:hypothetical protein